MDPLQENEFRSILRFGITEEKLEAFDIICLPETLPFASSIEELHDAGDAIMLSKLLKEQGIKCANSYDLDLPSQLLERRSKEKWFGIVFIKKRVALPVLIAVLSNLISGAVQEIGKDDKSQVGKIHIELKIEQGHNLTNIRYDGDGRTFISILKSIEADTSEKK